MRRDNQKIKAVDAITPSPVGDLGFCLVEGRLISIHFLPPLQAQNPAWKNKLKPILAELNAYFKNPQHRFTINIEPSGTAFQKKVWKVLQSIPSGETRSYLDLAKRLHTSPRAIGMACRSNPLPIFIPCHRVVAKTNLGGFCGETAGRFMRIKQALLEAEKAALVRNILIPT